jgi:serine/threonine-protein kinase SRPK3
MSTESSGSSQQIDFQFKFLKDRYIIIKKLGKGGHATVWLTYDAINKKYYALKIGNVDYYNESILETKILSKLMDCDYLVDCVSYFDYESESGVHHCNVMELMGCTLLDYIQHHKEISVDNIIKYTKQLLICLDTLHSNNIIHGDIKPENILVTKPSEKIQNLINKLDMTKIIKGTTLPKNEKKKDIILNSIKKVLSECGENIENNEDNNTDDTEDWETMSGSGMYSDTVYSDDDMNSDLFTISSDDTSSNIESVSDSASDLILENDNDQLNFNVKLTDMTSCIIKSDFPEKKLDTQYYRSPELLLRLPYDESSDMWALGCTIYEMITGSLLFDPDEYDYNNRYHLYLMTQRFGPIPADLIQQSKNRDVYFTSDMKKIKGFKKIYNDDLMAELREHFTHKNRESEMDQRLIDIVQGTLKLNPKERMTSKDASSLLADVQDSFRTEPDC